MDKVFRCYAEKKPGFDGAAQALRRELTEQLGVQGLDRVRILISYDVEGVDPAVYEKAKPIVFSEPQVDALYDEAFPLPGHPHSLLCVEALPGQYDQRADSAGQCIQLMTGGDRPLVRTATVYLLEGGLSAAGLERVKDHLINPVEAREASMDKPATLAQQYPVPDRVKTLEGFRGLDRAGLQAVLDDYGLATDLADLTFFQAYMKDEEDRDPTVTELRLVGTYWTDHCRHTTFSTHIADLDIADPAV